MKWARSSWLAPLFVAGAGAAGSAVQAQVAHWTNAAGGSFSDGANWDTAQAPGDHDTASFGLAADYTVNLGENAAIGALTVEQGTLALNAGSSRLDVGLTTGGPVIVGTDAATVATLRLLSGTMQIDLSSVRIGNVAGSTGVFIIEQGAQFLDSNGYTYIGGNGGTGSLLLRGSWTDTGISKLKNLYAGSTIRIESTGVLALRSLNIQGGTVEVDGGRLTAAAWGGTGTIRASNGARITTQESLNFTGGSVSIESGSMFDAAPCYALNGDVVVDGAGSRITGEFVSTSGSLTLRNGGGLVLPAGSATFGGDRIDVGPGCTFQVGLELNLHGGVFRADRGATLLIGSLQLSESPTLEFVLDGAALPTAPLVTNDHTPQLNGTMRPLFLHPNNLRVGDQVELLRMSNGAIASTFSNLDYEPLGGGRQLQLDYTDQSVILRVVAGGPSCWTADFDGDGDHATDSDILAFFACLAGNCCPTCASADFNGDGEESTDADIEAFFRVLGGGAC